MPHYRDGTEAQVGDKVKFTGWNGKVQVGEVSSIAPGATSCNATVAHTVMAPQATSSTVTLGEVELVHRDETA